MVGVSGEQQTRMLLQPFKTLHCSLMKKAETKSSEHSHWKSHGGFVIFVTFEYIHPLPKN